LSVSTYWRHHQQCRRDESRRLDTQLGQLVRVEREKGFLLLPIPTLRSVVFFSFLSSRVACVCVCVCVSFFFPLQCHCHDHHYAVAKGDARCVLPQFNSESPLITTRKTEFSHVMSDHVSHRCGGGILYTHSTQLEKGGLMRGCWVGLLGEAW